MSECARPLTVEHSPASMVLNTTELLEPILLYLDMRSLLTSALRVCRRWRDLIQGSAPLQRALFFECEETRAGSHEITFNPLLVECFPLLFDFTSIPSPDGFNNLAIEALPIGRRRVAFDRLDASWRRMHMRKPPVKHVALWTLDTIRRRKEKMKVVEYDGGLRMEGFYFLVLKHIYWWDLFVKWGEVRARQLCHFRFLRMHMIGPAEEMMRTADVTIGGLADDHCVEEEDARKPVDGSGFVKTKIGYALADNSCMDQEDTRKSMDSDGLVKMGIFWFKVKEINDGKVMWEEHDGPHCCEP